MNLTSLILFLVIGICAGWLAGKIMKGGGFGLVGDLVIGVLGAIFGGWIFGVLALPVPGGPIVGSLIVATIGAIALLFLIRLIKRV